MIDKKGISQSNGKKRHSMSIECRWTTKHDGNGENRPFPLLIFDGRSKPLWQSHFTGIILH